MAEAFYPFVENPGGAGAPTQAAAGAPAPQGASDPAGFQAAVAPVTKNETAPAAPAAPTTPATQATPQATQNTPSTRTYADITPTCAARIAVYDDEAAAPRVVTVEPKGVREYLEEITATVVRLAQEQGGGIPFMVIREIVENYIHAYFTQPTISILDGGNTIRFCDQGPGIPNKTRALEYGTSSATEPMKRYIRGVGSGLPYARHYLQDKGGSLTIEDNIGEGTVVTISLAGALTAAGGRTYAEKNPEVAPFEPTAVPAGAQHNTPLPQVEPAYTQQPYGGAPQGYPQKNFAQPGYQQPAYPAYQQGYVQPGLPQVQPGMYPQPSCPQQNPSYQPYPQAQPQVQPYAQPYGTPGYQQTYAQPYQQPFAAQTPQQAALSSLDSIVLDERERTILSYLTTHETVGPTELVDTYGPSQATWSRKLVDLEKRGLLTKHGQKRYLSELGRAWLQRYPL
jgi:hypothetical protein